MKSKIEVPRELLVVLADLNCPYDQLMAAKQRAAELLAAPEAPRQEPVCHVVDSHLQALLAGDEIKVDAWRRPSDGSQVAKRTPLYTAPLSPDHSGGAGEVVLPERLTVRNGIAGDECEAYTEGWNDCLDKVKELNQ